jgi:putative ABC transport system permease protein
MLNLLKIAVRNLLRYSRRTVLTMALIILGVVFVLVFVSVTVSFKDLMVRDITDSYMGHLQIHRKGYLEAIDSMPLHLNLSHSQVDRIREALSTTEGVKAFSERLKFGGAFSNFQQTTNIRLNGVDPASEVRTCPLLLSRLVEGEKVIGSFEPGKILVPELLAQGLDLKVGDAAVIVATNDEGSVNGKTFIVGGILASATGPGGRDGYIHIGDWGRSRTASDGRPGSERNRDRPAGFQSVGCRSSGA